MSDKKEENEKKVTGSKFLLIAGIIAGVTCIVSIITTITNPNASSYQDFSWMIIVFFIIPAIYSVFSRKKKQDNEKQDND